MENENDILMMNKIIRDLGFTGIGDKKSNRKTFFTITLSKLIDDIQNKTFNEIDLQGQEIENFFSIKHNGYLHQTRDPTRYKFIRPYQYPNRS